MEKLIPTCVTEQLRLLLYNPEPINLLKRRRDTKTKNNKIGE